MNYLIQKSSKQKVKKKTIITWMVMNKLNVAFLYNNDKGRSVCTLLLIQRSLKETFI
jgi:hypothetical protein